MFNIDIDSNRRIDSVLQDPAFITDITIQRIVSIALPFLNLNGKAAMVVSVGMSAYRSWTHLNEIIKAYQDGSWTSAGQASATLLLVITSTALTILLPVGQFIISNTYQLALTLYTLGLHIRNGDWQKGGKEFLQLAHQILHLLSVFYGAPEWLAVSLLVQAGVELYKAYHEHRPPEAIADLLLAGIRILSALPHLRTLHRNYFGQTLTQVQWEEIYASLEAFRLTKKPTQQIDVESFFIEKGISSHISNIQFNSTTQLTQLVFKNMKFENCNFTNVSFEGSTFHKINANSSLFEKTVWIHSVIQDSYFNHSSFVNAACLHSRVLGTTFTDSNMNMFSFNDSYLSRFSIIRCMLQETSFLNASVNRGSITDSDLTDCLLLDTKENFKIKGGIPHTITRPIVAISWNFKNRGLFTPVNDAALRENGAIPLRFEASPKSINREILDREVKDLMASIQTITSEGETSIPQEILKGAKENSEIGKIKQKAASLFRHCHGVALPGGDDIHPEFYGAKLESETIPENDYCRSIFEFALISNADKTKTPTMGTCRGAQLINVYFGGTLNQNVDGHWDVYQLMQHRESTHKDWIKNLVGEEFIAYSCHHQAIDRIGTNLEVVLEKDRIPKLLVSHDKTFIASQVHPEAYRELQKISTFYKIFLNYDAGDQFNSNIEKNRNIYRYFIAKAREKLSRLASEK